MNFLIGSFNSIFMEKYLLDELNQNEKQIKVFLLYIHHFLRHCSTYVNQGSYGCNFQALYDDFYFSELLNREWGYPYVSEPSIELLNLFHKKWVEYVYRTPYGDSFFVFYDPDWHKIVVDSLIPALKSFENDLFNHNIVSPEFETISNEFIKIDDFYNPKSRPSESELLWKVTNLYQLLLDKKIINKPYMGED